MQLRRDCKDYANLNLSGLNNFGIWDLTQTVNFNYKNNELNTWLLRGGVGLTRPWILIVKPPDAPGY